ncbi:MAG TPA: hypothetical protein VEQ60_25345 [Longimicrobium sp.]|nr:hypothetical protein [Longimicrobium sp.]
MEFVTEVPFTLPRGFQDSDGTLHREGRMRLATAADEILPLRDPRVKQNPAYLTVIVLSRVITRLGELSDVSTRVVEQLYASDVAYLQELYEGLNHDGEASVRAVCPSCEHVFQVEMAALGNE